MFITISSTAISWSSVPEQPLDVTSDGFRQGTTKKGIGSHQSRCESVVISRHVLFVGLKTFVSSCDFVRAGGELESGEEGGKVESKGKGRVVV